MLKLQSVKSIEVGREILIIFIRAFLAQDLASCHVQPDVHDFSSTSKDFTNTPLPQRLAVHHLVRSLKALFLNQLHATPVKVTLGWNPMQPPLPERMPGPKSSVPPM